MDPHSISYWNGHHSHSSGQVNNACFIIFPPSCLTLPISPPAPESTSLVVDLKLNPCFKLCFWMELQMRVTMEVAQESRASGWAFDLGRSEAAGPVDKISWWKQRWCELGWLPQNFCSFSLCWVENRYRRGGSFGLCDSSSTWMVWRQ